MWPELFVLTCSADRGVFLIEGHPYIFIHKRTLGHMLNFCNKIFDDETYEPENK